jgi:sugar phosphate permease
MHRCTSFKKGVYRYILRRFSGSMLNGKVRGSKHRWFENGKCEIKKRERKKKMKKKKRNTRLILVRVWLQMVVKEFVRSALSLIERFLKAVFLLSFFSTVCIYKCVCVSYALCQYLLKMLTKRINTNKYKNSLLYKQFLASLFD